MSKIDEKAKSLLDELGESPAIVLYAEGEEQTMSFQGNIQEIISLLITTMLEYPEFTEFVNLACIGYMAEMEEQNKIVEQAKNNGVN